MGLQWVAFDSLSFPHFQISKPAAMPSHETAQLFETGLPLEQTVSTELSSTQNRQEQAHHNS